MRWRIATGLVKPLSLNDRMHWAVKAKITKSVRTAIMRNAKALRVPQASHVHVQLVYVPRDNRRRDTDNLWATAKPAIDGLVDAGVIPDDTAQYVTRHEPRIDTRDRTLTDNRLWLEVWTEE